jgi:hypothetical protein
MAFVAVNGIVAELPGVRWRVQFVFDRLAEPPTNLSALLDAGRRRLLERGWHLAVCATDLPLQIARRPVIAHASATHGVAVLSMPALGPVSMRKRTAETIVRLVGHILGDLAPAVDAASLAQAVTRRMRELGGRSAASTAWGVRPWPGGRCRPATSRCGGWVRLRKARWARWPLQPGPSSG